MENAKNGAPSANEGLETSSLSRLAAPLPPPPRKWHTKDPVSHGAGRS